MSAKRRSKKNKNAAPRAKSRSGSSHVRTATVSVSSLEIARGHDGLFRGEPDPALLLGLFECRPTGIKLLDRRLVRFEVTGKIPGVYQPQAGDASLSARRVSGRVEETSSISLVVIAVEEDSGEGLAHLYELLEHPEALSFWRPAMDIPDVRDLANLPTHLATSASREALVLPVAALLADAKDVSELADGDDFIGAAIGHYGTAARTRTGFRATFTSADGKNSWTAVLELAVR